MPSVRHNPEKWARRSGQATQEYRDGAENPRRNWADSAAEASDNYEAGISEAIADDRFAKGVRKAGDEKWRRGIREKGATRYQQGVVVSEDAYDAGFRPFADVIERTSLPPRGPKGSNYERVQAIGEALRKAKRGN